MVTKTVTSRFVLKGDNQLSSAFSKAQKQLGSLAKKAALFGVAMAAATVAVVRSSLSMADTIGKTADSVGLTAEQFQEFEFAANRAGVASTQFASNMTAFVKRVGEAQTGMGPLVSGLKNLNPILLENLKNSKNQAEALGFMADAIQSAKTATERAALANAAFSRAGIGMVNMLDDGAKGLDKVAQEARDLGVVLREELVRDAEEATDKLGDLQKVLQITIAENVLENADAIIKLSESLIGFVGVVGDSVDAIGFLHTEFEALFGFIDNDDFVRLNDQLVAASERAGRLEASIKKLDGSMGTSGLQKTLAEVNEEIRTTQNLLDEIAAKPIPRAREDTLPERRTPSVLFDFRGMEEAIKIAGKLEADVDKILNKIIDDIATFGLSGGDKILFNLIDSGATEEQIVLIRVALDELRILNAIQDSAKLTAESRNALEEEYANLIASTRTAAEAHHEQITRIDELWIAGLIPSAEAYAEILERINEQFAETQQKVGELDQFAIQAARNLQTAFADFLFDPFDEGLKGMLRGFINIIRRMVAEAAAASILKALFGDGGAGGFLSTILGAAAGAAAGGAGGGGGGAGFYGPPRDHGGRGSPGQAYLIGRGAQPEVFIPDSAGTFIPNVDKLGGTNVTVNIDARENADPARLLALVPLIQATIEQNITLKARRGFL